jgi:hypothetical protein
MMAILAGVRWNLSVVFKKLYVLMCVPVGECSTTINLIIVPITMQVPLGIGEFNLRSAFLAN